MGAKKFKEEVFQKVQLELDQFGLVIYNANIKQLVDIPGHEYFSYLGQKTQMEVANQIWRWFFIYADYDFYTSYDIFGSLILPLL